MDRESALEKIRVLLEQNLELQLPETISESDRLFEDLSVDSIKVLQLIIYIEEEFDVAVPEEGLDPKVFSTVGTIIDLIDQLLQVKNA